MGKLKKYARSSNLMNFEIKYGSKTIEFNLYQELRIDENTINTDIENQPQIYSFIKMLYTFYIQETEKAKRDKESALAKAIERLLTSDRTKYYKERSTYPPGNLAEKLAKQDALYLKAIDKFINCQNTRDKLKDAVESFELRGELLRTLSANKRKTTA